MKFIPDYLLKWVRTSTTVTEKALEKKEEVSRKMKFRNSFDIIPRSRSSFSHFSIIKHETDNFILRHKDYSYGIDTSSDFTAKDLRTIAEQLDILNKEEG